LPLIPGVAIVDLAAEGAGDRTDDQAGAVPGGVLEHEAGPREVHVLLHRRRQLAGLVVLEVAADAPVDDVPVLVHGAEVAPPGEVAVADLDAGAAGLQRPAAGV